MDVKSPNFFFTNYVGHSPDDFEDYKETKVMIDHYIDSGLEDYLPQIYDVCAFDEKLTRDNIPFTLWEENNLIKPNVFYLHKELKHVNKSPEFDPAVGEKAYPYYCEMKERFTFEDLLSYANREISNKFFESKKYFASTLRYMMKRYSSMKEKINMLDMVLFMIDECRNTGLSNAAITDNEEAAAEKIVLYREKLEQLGKDHVVWRTYTSN